MGPRGSPLARYPSLLAATLQQEDSEPEFDYHAEYSEEEEEVDERAE